MSQKASRRGIQSFLSLTENETTKSEQYKLQLSKGRSKELIEDRNNLLFVRYWYYVTFTNNRFDIILELLSFEFKLAQRRVADLLSEDRSVVKTLKQIKPTLKALKQIYPFFVWEVNFYYNVELIADKEKMLFKQK